MTKILTVTQADGSVWAVPVDMIARNRAEVYADEFGDDIERSIAEGTGPLFAEDSYEVIDWAANNMNWSEVESVAFKIKDADPPDFQTAWMNGAKSVEDHAAMTKGSAE